MIATKNISSKPRPTLECLLLVCFTAAMRCLFIGKTDLGFDEGFTLYMAQLSIPDIVKNLCLGDNPPLWELLLHGWIKVFGISETAIRSLSLIFSVLTVIPIYFIGEKHIHRFAGIAAALCYCCSTFSIFMSHECRVYSLIGCMTACSAWLFISAIKEPKPFKFILLTIANLTLMYGHYLSVWVIVMEFIIVMVVKPVRTRIWKPYLIHAAALIVLFTPMFPVLFSRFMDSGMNGTWIAKSTGLDDLYNMLWKMCNMPISTLLSIGIMVSALVVWIIRMSRKEYHWNASTTLTMLWLIPLLVSFTLSFFTGFFLDRYFYFLFPLFYLAIVSYCISLFPKREFGGLCLMSVFVISMAIFCSPDSSKQHYSGWHYPVKPLVNQLVEAKNNDNALIIMPEYFDKQFVYYLDDDHELFSTHRMPVDYYVFRDYLHQEGYFYDNEYLQADLSQYSEVVFPYWVSAPMQSLEAYLKEKGFQLTNEQVFDPSPYIIRHYSAAPSNLP